MLNSEPKRNHLLNPELKLQTNDSIKNNDNRSIFTLIDGIRLLQSNKNNSLEQIIKLPNLKISTVKKNNNEKTNSSKENNLLKINSIKGKSIFNNSILDNVLGTININNDQMQKSFFVKKSYNYIFNKTKTNNLIKENSNNFIEPNTFFKQNKTILNLKKEFINSNYENDENETNKHENFDENLKINKINNDINKNTKNNLEKKKVIFLNKNISNTDKTFENLPLLTMDSNFNKRSNYSINLRLLKDFHQNFKSNSKSKLVNNIKLYDDREITEITNNNSNYHFNLLNNPNSTIYKSSINTNLINNFNTQINSSVFFSTTMQNYNQGQVNSFNKPNKFELYKQNKIHEFDGNYTSNFFINQKNITFDINSTKIELNKTKNNHNFNNNPNFNLNLDMNSTSRTIVIEASTQTKCNLSSALDDKNCSIISDKENLINTLNENLNKNKNNKNIRVLNDDEEDFFQIKENNKEENYHLIFNNRLHENESKNNNVKNNKKLKKKPSDSTILYDTNINDYNKEFNIDNKSNKFECNIFKMKDIRKNQFNKTNKINNQIIQNNNPVTYIKKNKFLSPIQSNNDKCNSNNSYGFNNSPNSYNSTNLIYKKISNFEKSTKNDFNKEIFRNSKILRENFIGSYKNKKKSQTCYMGENSTTKKLANIKYSKNVQM